MNDEKFAEPEYQKDSIECGEALAFSTLSSEYYVLWLAGVKTSEHHKYIGRAQYPKIVNKPVLAPMYKESRYLTPQIDPVYEISNRLNAMYYGNGDPEQHISPISDRFLEARDAMPIDIRDHLDGQVDVYSLQYMLRGHNDFLAVMLGIFDLAVESMFRQKLSEVNKEWRNFGKHQFTGSPSVFFANIAKEHREKTRLDSTAESNCFDPSAYLNEQADNWAVWWDPITDEMGEEFAPKFHRLRKYCIKHITPPVVNPEIQTEAMKHYPNKAKGCDNQTSKEFIGFPIEARILQCQAMQKAYDLFVVCHQLLCTLSASIGKQGGGSRTIGLTPMWHRLFGKADTTVREWESNNVKEFDKAGKGKSALTTAALLSLKTEIDVALNYFVVSAFHDIKKFFDSMDPNILFHAVLEQGFPKGTFVLAIAAHLAPRILLLQSYCSAPIPITASILAGCFVAIALTKVYMRKELCSVQDKNAEVDLDIYIDDVNQYVSGPNYQDVLDQVYNAITDFSEGAGDLKLTLSEKAGLVTNPPWLASCLSKHLKVKGIHLKPKSHYKYLGTSYNGGAKRCNQVIVGRFQSTSNRKRRNANIAKQFRGARKLFSGSTFHAMVWGHPISGLSSTMLLDIERTGARCSGIHPAGKCRFTTNCVVYGPFGHPVARVLKELFRTWFDTLAELFTLKPDMYPDLRQTWVKKYEQMQITLQSDVDSSLFEFSRSKLDKHMTGILSNVLGMLLRLGWNPKHFDIWQNPLGEAYILRAAKDNITPLLYDIINSYNSLQYARAAQHFDGKGMEQGVEWHYTLSLVHSWRRSKDNWISQLLAALETILAGAAWPQARVGDIFQDQPVSCVLCGETRCDSYHNLWGCLHINSIDDSNIQKSNHLIPKANNEATSLPCYWLRGIMPKEFGQLPLEHTNFYDQYVCSYYMSPPPAEQWPSGDYFGDAGGGKHNLYPTLRRIGLLRPCSYA